MRIQQLVVKNFQRWKRYTLDLDPLVTTLIGRNGAGKSALLRALRWVCQNRPLGDSFIRWGAKGCRVSLVVDGQRISRAKGKGGNRYELDGKQFKALGAGQLPPQVASLLNIGDATFQGQHDASFWLSNTPGEVSRALNGVVNLGIIDRALSQAGAMTRRQVAVVDVCRERQTAAIEARKSLAWVVGADTALKAVEGLAARLDATRAKLGALAATLETAQRSRAALGAATARAESTEAMVGEIREQWEFYRASREKIERLETLLCELESVESESKAAKAEANRAAVHLTRLQLQRCPLCGTAAPSVSR